MKIIISYFLLSMLVTFILLYLVYPSPNVIIKYPNVKNEVSDVYIDENNVCYKYHRKEVPCK